MNYNKSTYLPTATYSNANANQTKPTYLPTATYSNANANQTKPTYLLKPNQTNPTYLPTQTKPNQPYLNQLPHTTGAANLRGRTQEDAPSLFCPAQCHPESCSVFIKNKYKWGLLYPCKSVI